MSYDADLLCTRGMIGDADHLSAWGRWSDDWTDTNRILRFKSFLIHRLDLSSSLNHIVHLASGLNHIVNCSSILNHTIGMQSHLRHILEFESELIEDRFP